MAAAVQRGEDPPGIRVVEDRLSVDTPAIAVASKHSPPKPWEAAAGASARAAAHTALREDGGSGSGLGMSSGRGYSDGEEEMPPQHTVSVGP